MTRSLEHHERAAIAFRARYGCHPHERPDLLLEWCELLVDARANRDPAARNPTRPERDPAASATMILQALSVRSMTRRELTAFTRLTTHATRDQLTILVRARVVRCDGNPRDRYRPPVYSLSLENAVARPATTRRNA